MMMTNYILLVMVIFVIFLNFTMASVSQLWLLQWYRQFIIFFFSFQGLKNKTKTTKQSFLFKISIGNRSEVIVFWFHTSLPFSLWFFSLLSVPTCALLCMSELGFCHSFFTEQYSKHSLTQVLEQSRPLAELVNMAYTR